MDIIKGKVFFSYFIKINLAKGVDAKAFVKQLKQKGLIEHSNFSIEKLGKGWKLISGSTICPIDSRTVVHVASKPEETYKLGIELDKMSPTNVLRHNITKIKSVQLAKLTAT